MKRRLNSNSNDEKNYKQKSQSNYIFSKNLNRDNLSFEPNFSLVVRQNAQHARVCSFKEKVDRRPIDPPPIIQIKSNEPNISEFHQSTTFFMTATLIHSNGLDDTEVFNANKSRSISGITVQTPVKLKDTDGTDGSFCIWSHLSVRQEGQFRLKFRLFERRNLKVVEVVSAVSDIFTVHNPRNFPGMSQSSYLTRCFADQGVRIRIRKENKVSSKRININSGDNTPTSLPTSSMETSMIPSTSNSSSDSVTYQNQNNKNLSIAALMNQFHQSQPTNVNRSQQVIYPNQQSSYPTLIPFNSTNDKFTQPSSHSRIYHLPPPLPPEDYFSYQRNSNNRSEFYQQRNFDEQVITQSTNQLQPQSHSNQGQSQVMIAHLLNAAETLSNNEEQRNNNNINKLYTDD